MAASRTPPYCTRQQAQKTDTRIDAERKQKESRKTKREIDTRRSGGRKIRDSRRDGTHTADALPKGADRATEKLSAAQDAMRIASRRQPCG